MVSFLKIRISHYFYIFFFFYFTKLPSKLFLCKIMKTKNSYHTALVLKAQLGMLSKSERSRIPNSTFSDWKKRNLSLVVGFTEDDPVHFKDDVYRKISESKAFKKTLSALLLVFQFYFSLTENMRGKRRIWSEQKKNIVSIVSRISPLIGIKAACKLLKISSQRFYRWKNEVHCFTSTFNLCRKLHPKQLTSKEQTIIAKYLKKPELQHWPLRSVFYQMLNDSQAFMNLSTFYKYVRVLRPDFKRFQKPKQKIGIRASSPLTLLHMDTTILRVQDGSKAYIHFIMDNFSRTILGWKASLEWNAKNTVSNLKEVCEKFNLFHKPIRLLCDDGSENQGDVNGFLDQPNLFIEKLIAQVNISYSNSMIEAVNKKMKYEFLFPKNPASFEEVSNILKDAVPEYNSRPSGVLFGFSPNQVLNGDIPDKHRFIEQIKEAAAKRPKINKQGFCDPCSDQSTIPKKK
ncbi:integrase core domain protein [Leptospira interrogans serovar Grippotyphosa str. UI 12769]|uniref:DDE-type integrase/transposase/recombinase n=1 Tax=Leptospira interrogans TaxID=173 RepID=UPI000297C95C|nr:DDE-type integrase/transposase/recombinase [Leptospira interrogans]EKR19959.1 integrase core domain protein [Leptospira interrogans serovar Pyrogenes str. 2006006960]EKR44739.1 integrase core domain protein [Leptospira interrogans serovar Grippotyphosa str. UI 08368]EMN80828.1 integrase core domain protein [Leptospira interrogans serovar Grippotyphosa str. UI 12764]EMN87351.1 integrase core domain protein [Leptospira interrogans serovar Grippotyphosa str. UI 12769]